MYEYPQLRCQAPGVLSTLTSLEGEMALLQSDLFKLPMTTRVGLSARSRAVSAMAEVIREIKRTRQAEMG